MKLKPLLPVIFLAFLISAPIQVQAQSKRAERKLKREMRKLDKQMKKVSELKQDAFVFRFDRDDFFDGEELQELRGLGYIHGEIAEKQKLMAKKQYKAAKKQSVEAREMAQRYQKINIKRIKEQQHRSQDHARRAIDQQHHQLKEIRESDNNLSINKTLKNESVKKEHNFTVSDDASYIDFRIKGSVESGEVKIVLKTPKGEEYQAVELNSSADVNWNQKMKLQGEKTDQYKGKWTISVKGNDVTGHFSIYMRSK